MPNINDNGCPISETLPAELGPRIVALREMAEKRMLSLETKEQRDFAEGAFVYLCQLDVEETA